MGEVFLAIFLGWLFLFLEQSKEADAAYRNLMFLSVAVIFAVAVVVIFLLVLVWGVGSYNGLVAARTRFQHAFAQMDLQFKRRYELIPNLVQTARGFMRHERETLEAVVAARNYASSALQTLTASPADGESIQRLLQAEKALEGVMGRLMAVSEAYPELKANQNMVQITEELASTENRLSLAKQGYNEDVKVFNLALKTFPTVLIANFLGFQEGALLEMKEKLEKEAPEVNFS